MTDRGPIAWRVRTRLIPLIAPLLFRLDAVRRFLFRTVSQTGVNYRHSPLSEGKAGSVWAGDRLPWVKFSAEDDNFASLKSVAWQVHIYGEPRDGLSGNLRLLNRRFASCLRVATRNAKLRSRSRSLYLVRPDGYVALAEPGGDPAQLRRYFESRALIAYR